MRFINILTGFIILICVVSVSCLHTVALFESVGFQRVEAILIVIAVEAIFLLSCLNLVVSRIRQTKPGLPAIAGFLYGTALVGWSNVSYVYDHGIAGWLLGASIPVGLIIAEGVITREIIGEGLRADAQADQKPAQQPANHSAIQPANQPTGEPVKQTTSEEPTSRETLPEAIDQPGDGHIDQPKRPNKQPNDQPNNHPDGRGADQPTKVSIKRADENQPASETDEQPTTLATDRKEKQPSKPANRKSSKKYVTDLTPIKQAAIQHRDPHGKLPSRDKLTELTGYPKNACRRALAELRKTDQTNSPSEKRPEKQTDQPASKTASKNPADKEPADQPNRSDKQPNNQPGEEPTSQPDNKPNPTSVKSTRQEVTADLQPA